MSLLYPKSALPTAAGLPSATTLSGARQAALLLHAMSANDRAWALDALPLHQRNPLVALLDELCSLGIARDPTLVNEAIGGSARLHAPETLEHAAGAAASPEDTLRALDASGVRRLVTVMRSEPAALVAQWLRVADWPWRAELLAGLTPAHRAQVTGHLDTQSPDVPPMLRSTLVQAVAVRLQELPVAAETESVHSAWRPRLLAWFEGAARAVRPLRQSQG